MLANNPDQRSCVYCGAPATTDDHIPAQNLLVGVPRRCRPSVPACSQCNTGASQDDEYFRDVVVKYRRVAERPEAQPAVDAMLRALSKPEKHAYARRTIESYHDVAAVTEGGIYLGMQPAYRVDGRRIARTAERYVRGLHFLERGMRVPSDHFVKVHVNIEAIIREQARVAAAFTSSTIRVVGQRIFFYGWAIPSDQPSASAWLLVFFDGFPLLAFIHPPRRADSIAPAV
jgi:hypothetical protein